MNKVYIYCIYFPTSNKRYIGQTGNIKIRIFQHIKRDYPVGRALRKYNDWRVHVLHTVKTRDEANRIEIEEIRNFNSVAPNGYNLTRGGDGTDGHKHSEESKAKISLNNKGMKGKHQSKKARAKISAALLGKKHGPMSKETKAKMSASSKIAMNRLEVKRKISAFRIGKEHSEATKNKISIKRRKI